MRAVSGIDSKAAVKVARELADPTGEPSLLVQRREIQGGRIGINI